MTHLKGEKEGRCVTDSDDSKVTIIFQRCIVTNTADFVEINSWQIAYIRCLKV